MNMLIIRQNGAVIDKNGTDWDM